MMFFSIRAETQNKKEIKAREARRTYALTTQSKNDDFYQKHRRNVFMFIAEIAGSQITAAIFIKSDYLANISIDSLAETYFEMLGIKCKGIQTTEITYSAVRSLLNSSNREDYIKDDCATLKMLNLNLLDEINFSESILFDIPQKKALLETADRLLCGDSLKPEISRIFEGSTKSIKAGHPVHYMIQTDNGDTRSQIIDTLLCALYSAGRIKSKRYCSMVYEPDDCPPDNKFHRLYESCKGGAMVIEYSCSDETEDDHARPGVEIISRLCDTAKKHKNDVLTVFCLPYSCERIKSTFVEHLGSMALVPLTEDVVFGERARSYLRQMAHNVGLTADRSLYRNITDTQKGYRASDLARDFDCWFSNKMKTKIYPQYAQMEAADKIMAKSGPKGSAYTELERMIGLAEAKAIINQALNFYKAQKLFQSKGMQADNTAMHMVFTGNPGTAKTTVARLFAQIMKENGLLSVGDLIEVGRADLVGKYLGWTAPIVKNYFKSAKGSVLFIDEAYSLVDDKAGLYGDEAINTIVQEMENRREDMVVIFAGYPDKMEQFLQTNPGLRSRIAFHVPFADYSADDLYGILELMAENKKVKLCSDVRGKLIPIFERAVSNKDFGNGRYVRNIFEKARLCQASRLVAMGIDKVTNDDIRTLNGNDFEVPNEIVYNRRRIGFST